jgi:molybdate transport system substrate-binding protein
VGRVGVGVVIRRGGEAPDVSSPDALRRALLAARAVIYNRGSTGQYIDALLGRLGVSDQVAAKTIRFDSGDQVMERLAAGAGNEIGFGAIPDIRLRESAGVRLVAPLPAAIQNYTVYQAAPLTASRVPSVAARFVTFITSAAARQRFAAAGIEAVD